MHFSVISTKPNRDYLNLINSGILIVKQNSMVHVTAKQLDVPCYIK